MPLETSLISPSEVHPPGRSDLPALPEPGSQKEVIASLQRILKELGTAQKQQEQGAEVNRADVFQHLADVEKIIGQPENGFLLSLRFQEESFPDVVKANVNQMTAKLLGIEPTKPTITSKESEKRRLLSQAIQSAGTPEEIIAILMENIPCLTDWRDLIDASGRVKILIQNESVTNLIEIINRERYVPNSLVQALTAEGWLPPNDAQWLNKELGYAKTRANTLGVAFYLGENADPKLVSQLEKTLKQKGWVPPDERLAIEAKLMELNDQLKNLNLKVTGESMDNQALTERLETANQTIKEQKERIWQLNTDNYALTTQNQQLNNQATLAETALEKNPLLEGRIEKLEKEIFGWERREDKLKEREREVFFTDEILRKVAEQRRWIARIAEATRHLQPEMSLKELGKDWEAAKGANMAERWRKYAAKGKGNEKILFSRVIDKYGHEAFFKISWGNLPPGTDLNEAKVLSLPFSSEVRNCVPRLYAKGEITDQDIKDIGLPSKIQGRAYMFMEFLDLEGKTINPGSAVALSNRNRAEIISHGYEIHPLGEGRHVPIVALGQWLEVLAQIEENNYHLADNTPFDGASWDVTAGRLQMFDFNAVLSLEQITSAKDKKEFMHSCYIDYPEYIKETLIKGSGGWKRVLMSLSKNLPDSPDYQRLLSLSNGEFSYSQAGLDEETTQMMEDILKAGSVREMANRVKGHSSWKWYAAERKKLGAD